MGSTLRVGSDGLQIHTTPSTIDIHLKNTLILSYDTATGVITLGSTTLDATVISATELSYLDGVTSAIQTQLNLKAPLASPTLTGVPILPLGFKLGSTVISASAAEVNYLSGVTSAIQTQLDARAPSASPTFTGTVTIPLPFTLGATSMTASGSELNFVVGVTSAIQTQLDAKAPAANPLFTGTFASTPTSAFCTSAQAALSLTYTNVGLVTDGSSQECSGTLSNGVAGQIVNVYCEAVGNAADSIRIIPSPLLGWASVNLAANTLGNSATFLYTNTGWVVLSCTGTLA